MVVSEVSKERWSDGAVTARGGGALGPSRRGKEQVQWRGRRMGVHDLNPQTIKKDGRQQQTFDQFEQSVRDVQLWAGSSER